MDAPIEAQAAASAPLVKSDGNKPVGPGRPTVMTPEILRKIEEVAALDGSVEEMAYYAGIHRATLYRWLNDNEELRDRIDELRERPILKARQTIVGALDQPDHAFRYLERKRAKEFMPQSKINHGGGVTLTPGQITPEVEDVKNRYEQEMKLLLSKPDPNKLTPRVEETPQGNNEHGPAEKVSGSGGTPDGQSD